MQLVEKFQSQPHKGAGYVPWIRQIMLQHASYLLTVPNLPASLAGLYQVVDARLASFKKLVKLSGEQPSSRTVPRARCADARPHASDLRESAPLVALQARMRAKYMEYIRGWPTWFGCLPAEPADDASTFVVFIASESAAGVTLKPMSTATQKCDGLQSPAHQLPARAAPHTCGCLCRPAGPLAWCASGRSNEPLALPPAPARMHWADNNSF